MIRLGVVASLREVAIVLFKAIAPNTFLRVVPLTIVVSSSAAWRQMRICLVRIPHRKGHSIPSNVLLASTIAGPDRRIHSPTRVGPNGRDLKLPQGNSDRTTGPHLDYSFLLSVLSDLTATSWRLP